MDHVAINDFDHLVIVQKGQYLRECRLYVDGQGHPGEIQDPQVEERLAHRVRHTDTPLQVPRSRLARLIAPDDGRMGAVQGVLPIHPPMGEPKQVELPFEQIAVRRDRYRNQLPATRANTPISGSLGEADPPMAAIGRAVEYREILREQRQAENGLAAEAAIIAEDVGDRRTVLPGIGLPIVPCGDA